MLYYAFILFLYWIIYSIATLDSSQNNKTTYKEPQPRTNTYIPYPSKASIKGAYGETLLYNNLHYFESCGAKILRNCYLPKGQNQTTEIDVLLITNAGIFVFENKNYNGWIFGDEHSHYWTQVLPIGRGRSKKTQFMNPIHQNSLHIRYLTQLLYRPVPIYPIVVFSNECEFKKVNIINPYTPVIKLSNVYSTVNNILLQNPNILTQNDIDDLYSRLYRYTQISHDTIDKHINNINNKHHR